MSDSYGYETDDDRQIRGLRETIAELVAERDALKAALRQLYDADMAARSGDNGWRWQDAMRAAEAALAGGRK